jgi:hypothetical protein
MASLKSNPEPQVRCCLPSPLSGQQHPPAAIPGIPFKEVVCNAKALSPAEPSFKRQMVSNVNQPEVQGSKSSAMAPESMAMGIGFLGNANPLSG